MTGHIAVERSGNVAIVTIDNTAVRNALSIEMADEIQRACDEIDASADIGCTIVCGAGGTFCSGADTRSWDESYGADPLTDQAYDITNRIYGSFVRFGALKAPSIAVVRGAAVGAGLNLALAADLRVAADDARLVAGFTAAGIHPGGGFFTLVDRLAGREAAALLGLFGAEIDGARAREVGLVSLAVPDLDAEPVALELARSVAADPLLARRVKRSFQLETQGTRLEWPVALELERGVQLWSQRRRFANKAAKP